MSGSNTKIEWYLARDGQQHGPLSDPELKKFIELGHLHPTDLVWRAGFPEWRTASEVFPETDPSPPPPPAPPFVDAPAEPTAASVIEDIGPGGAEATPQDQANVDQAGSSPASQTSSGEQVADVTRHDSPTQRDVRSQDVSQDRPKLDGGQTGGQPSEPASDKTESVQQATSPQTNQPAGAPAQAGSAPSPAAPQGQPQFQQADPRLGGVSPGGMGQGGAGGPSPQAAPQQPGGPQANNGPIPGQQNQPGRPGHQPYGAPPPGQQPGQPHPQAGWQQPTGGAPQPGPGGPHGAPQPGLGATNPNVYGNPAAGVYPGAGQQPHPGFQQGSAGQQSRSSFDDDDDFYDDDDFDSQPRRRPVVAAVVSLVLIAMIGAGGWFAYANQAALIQVFNELTNEATGQQQPEVVAAPETPARVAADSTKQPTEVKTAAASPARKAAPQPAPAAVASYSELPIFKTQFWRSFNALYPAWAKAQESNAGKLQASGKSSDEVLATIVKSLVEWRRSNADEILAASPDHLRTLAKTFVTNLKFLVTQDVQSCYGYISKGELSPAVLPLFGNPQHVGKLGTQTEAIIAAAQNGSSSKKSYPEPINQDFTDLANLLLKRGWSETDLKMFSDPTELSNAPAAKVCSLVTQWFETQLEMPPSDKQMRLLATSLQPVVRG